jgi:hypothetical protein
MLLALCQYCLFCADFVALFLQIESDPAEEPHVDVRHPDQGKAGDEVSAPIRKQELVACDDQEGGSHVVAEAILTSKEIKEFALVDAPTGFTFAQADVAQFPDNFLMRNGPCNRCDGKRNDKQRKYLERDVHSSPLPTSEADLSELG